MVYTVGVGPHNIPHCCPLLKKTPLPEWHLDMWYLWRWAPYIQDTLAVCKEINTNMKSRNSLLRKCFLRPVVFIQYVLGLIFSIQSICLTSTFTEFNDC